MVLLLALLIALPACALAVEIYDAVIVRGDIPVDLLVAQAYTAKAGIPLVTVTEKYLPAELEDELIGFKEQGYKNILIIGGDEAIPNSIDEHLNSKGFVVTRIWDWNRYGTSARVAMNLWETSETVVVTQGNPGELMLAAKTAIEYKSPLLITSGDTLPEELKTAISSLGATRIVLIGDASEAVKKSLAELGGLQQTNVRPVNRTEPSRSVFFVIGIIIGGLAIFLVSSLWGAVMFRNKLPKLLNGVFESDEQKVLKLLNGGELKQEDLPKLTGFSRPKVTRVVSGLIKSKKIVREKRGKTFVLKSI